MELTSNIFWIVLVVALGLPSAVVSFFMKRIEKSLERNEDARKEKEDKRIEHEELTARLIMASLGLAQATAEAVQRIPDSNCNGDMTVALNEAKLAKEAYRKLERELTAKALN